MSRRATWGTRRDQSCGITESPILQTHTVGRGTGLEEKKGGEKKKETGSNMDQGESHKEELLHLSSRQGNTVQRLPKRTRQSASAQTPSLPPRLTWLEVLRCQVMWKFSSWHCLPALTMSLGVGIIISALQKRKLRFRGPHDLFNEPGQNWDINRGL